MEFKMEILSRNRALIGFSYNKGRARAKGKEVIFHEFGFGIGFLGIFLTFY